LPVFRRKQRRLKDANNGKERKKCRRFDYEGAINNIQRDYLGVEPLFGHYFERLFRVSELAKEFLKGFYRLLVPQVLSLCCNTTVSPVSLASTQKLRFSLL
jgi:hypothetical protein